MDKKTLPATRKPRFGITQMEAHEAWWKLSGTAAKVMHLLCSRVGNHNAVVISQKTIADMMQISPRSVARAIKELRDDRWIEVRQFGLTTSVNAYVINSRVHWHQGSDNMRFAELDARLVISSSEQPDQDELGNQAPLRQLPKADEYQIPAGPGMDPPSEPALPGMEPDLPAAGEQVDIEDYDPETGEIR